MFDTDDIDGDGDVDFQDLYEDMTDGELHPLEWMLLEEEERRDGEEDEMGEEDELGEEDG